MLQNISSIQKSSRPLSDASLSGACRGVTYLPRLQLHTQSWSLQLHAPFPGEPQPRAEGQRWVQGVLSCSEEKQQSYSFLTLSPFSLPCDRDISEGDQIASVSWREIVTPGLTAYKAGRFKWHRGTPSALNTSSFCRKQYKVANALWIYVTFYTRNGLLADRPSDTWFKFYAFSLFWSFFMLP